MYPGVDLRLQRYAVVLADELNFTKAAQRLHLAQPALSRAIHQLEEYLEVQLFVRHTRSVELTPAGRKFVYEARKAIHYAERAVEIAAREKNKDSLRLVVGYPSYCDLEFIAELTKLTVHSLPELQVVYHSSSPAEIVHQILRQEWHCGILDLPSPDPSLQLQFLFASPLNATLHPGHLLAQKQILDLKELANQPLVFPDRRMNPALANWFEKKCKSRGFAPHIVQEVATPQQAIYLAAKGAGIAITRDLAMTREPIFNGSHPNDDYTNEDHTNAIYMNERRRNDGHPTDGQPSGGHLNDEHPNSGYSNVVCLPLSDNAKLPNSKLAVDTALVFPHAPQPRALRAYVDTVVPFSQDYARRFNPLPHLPT